MYFGLWSLLNYFIYKILFSADLSRLQSTSLNYKVSISQEERKIVLGLTEWSV